MKNSAVSSTVLSSHPAHVHISQIGFCVYDLDLKLVAHSKEFVEIFRLTQDQLKTGVDLEHVSNLCGLRCLHGRDEPNGGGEPVRPSDETSIVRTAHGRILVISRCRAVDGSWIEVYEDISERAQREHRLLSLAYRDPVTGLCNRNYIDEFFHQKSQGRDIVTQTAVLYIDLDKFKHVNDAHGHDVGDVLLRKVAKRLTGCTREGDVVARIGGDEFIILQNCDVDPIVESSVLASRLLQVIAHPFSIKKTSISIGLSIGISISNGRSKSIKSAIKDADKALYIVKGSGRGIYRHFT